MRVFLAVVLLTLAASPAAADTRLVVFEAQDCRPCALFRGEVLPAFWGGARKQALAITVVDVDALGTGGFALAHRLDTLPTIVLIEDGRERARVSGYVGREQFLALVERMRYAGSQ